MEYQNFKLEIDEQGIAVFTANRPEKMNALNDFFMGRDEPVFYMGRQSR